MLPAIELVAGIWMVTISAIVTTERGAIMSALLFKVAPLFLGSALGLFAIARFMGWLPQV
jgi:hypothetical protein